MMPNTKEIQDAVRELKKKGSLGKNNLSREQQTLIMKSFDKNRKDDMRLDYW